MFIKRSEEAMNKIEMCRLIISVSYFHSWKIPDAAQDQTAVEEEDE